jgi:[ribosomal protein S5]-alanine N-acetyltransferase
MTPFLEGENIFLREVFEADVKGPMLYWTNDKEVTRYLYRGAQPASLERALADFHKSQTSETDIELAIVVKNSEKLIGVTGLHGIDLTSRLAEFRILLGEKSEWGKGYGTEVVELISAYGFEVLNLHKVYLGVNAHNTRALKSYLNTGFKQEGVLRDEFLRSGKYVDVVRMGILYDEYREIKSNWITFKKIQQQYPGQSS